MNAKDINNLPVPVTKQAQRFALAGDHDEHWWVDAALSASLERQRDALMDICVRLERIVAEQFNNPALEALWQHEEWLDARETIEAVRSMK